MKKITYSGRYSNVFMPKLGLKAKRGEELEVTDSIAERATAMYPDVFMAGAAKKKKTVGGDQ